MFECQTAGYTGKYEWERFSLQAISGDYRHVYRLASGYVYYQYIPYTQVY